MAASTRMQSKSEFTKNRLSHLLSQKDIEVSLIAIIDNLIYAMDRGRILRQSRIFLLLPFFPFFPSFFRPPFFFHYHLVKVIQLATLYASLIEDFPRTHHSLYRSLCNIFSKTLGVKIGCPLTIACLFGCVAIGQPERALRIIRGIAISKNGMVIKNQIVNYVIEVCFSNLHLLLSFSFPSPFSPFSPFSSI